SVTSPASRRRRERRWATPARSSPGRPAPPRARRKRSKRTASASGRRRRKPPSSRPRSPAPFGPSGSFKSHSWCWRCRPRARWRAAEAAEVAVAAVSACRPIRHSIHELRVWQSGVVRQMAALYRVIFGSDTDPALRPILGINFAGSLAGSTVWSFVGIWAIKKLGADQSVLGLAYLVSALIGVGSGYLGGHLSDHFGRRPLIFIGWIGQTAVVLGFVAAGSSATRGLLVLCFGGLFFQLGNAAGQALVADLVPDDRHEPAYAAVRVASNLGVTFGPPLGGLLLLLGSWNALFLGAAALSALGFALAVLFLPARGAYAPE